EGTYGRPSWAAAGFKTDGEPKGVLDPSGRGYLDVLRRDDGARSPEGCGTQHKYADA
ncbi:hypothetical protein IMZ48_01795, partial [Candidatus Bathyarchaeota archaeon]|nr:hypothetical protein [Candidatus Bathyarchaeota archaeon]